MNNGKHIVSMQRDRTLPEFSRQFPTREILAIIHPAPWQRYVQLNLVFLLQLQSLGDLASVLSTTGVSEQQASADKNAWLIPVKYLKREINSEILTNRWDIDSKHPQTQTIDERQQDPNWYFNCFAHTNIVSKTCSLIKTLNNKEVVLEQFIQSSSVLTDDKFESIEE